MAGSLIAFVWRHSKWQQLWLLLLTLVSFPFVYASLEVPKIIINEAINGTDFPRSVLGLELQQIPFLLALCGLFLALVLAINGFKWVINVGIGMAGERLLRRMRYGLYEHVMRFPMGRLRRLRSGETIQSIMGELEPLGGFFGEVMVTPVFQGGLLAVYVAFIFVQDLWLGLAAVSLYPLQAWLVPYLQAKIVRLNRERARNARSVAEEIGHSIAIVAEIRGNATAHWHLSRVGARLFRNTQIRLEIFRRKFTIKLLNNMINQVTPFLFYSAGGYLVIVGRLDFGALVAVLAAYKDVAGPWKALLAYVQRYSDFGARYRFVIEDFVTGDLIAPDRALAAEAPRLEGPLVAEGARGGSGGGAAAIPMLTVRPGEWVAVTGGDGGARRTALAMLAGLEPATEGRIAVGGTDLSAAPIAAIGASIALVGPDPGTIPGTVRENLLYGLFRSGPPLADGEARSEAMATGNPVTDAGGDWVDFRAAGAPDAAALEASMLDLIAAFDLSRQLYDAALDLPPPEAELDRLAPALLGLKRRLADGGSDLADLLEPWEPTAFASNGTLLANLLFALPVEPAFRPADLLAKPKVAAALAAHGGGAVLEEAGWRIARELAALAEALGAGAAIFDRLGGFDSQAVADAERIVGAAGTRGRAAVPSRDRGRLRTLAAGFVEERDQLDILDDDLKRQVLDARDRALPGLRADPHFVALDAARINPARRLADTILGASRRFDRRAAWPRISERIEAAVRAEGIWRELVRLGLGADLAALELPSQAVRRLALVRAVLTRPAILVLDGIADGDGIADRTIRAALRDALPETSVIFAASAAVKDADRRAEIDALGRLVPADAGP